jgi:hypothetical protein
MKTAMQELIKKLKGKGGGMEIYLNANTEIINEALEKEKEQITKAYKDHHDIGHIFGLDTEQYYNQTYNPKIPELLYKDGTPMRKVKLGKEAQELLDEATKRFNQPNL